MGAASIEDVAGRLWPGREIRITPIAAGLTNQNFRVEVDGRPFFVRLPGASTDLLAVDRANELHNTRAAAEAGVGPRVVHHDPESGALVLDWIDGRTMSNQAFAAPGTPLRIAASLRQLLAVALGDPDRTPVDDGQVVLRQPEHVEVVAEARAGVELPE